MASPVSAITLRSPVPQPPVASAQPARRPYLLGLLYVYAFLIPFEGFTLVAGGGADTIFKPYRMVGLTLVALLLVQLCLGARRITFDRTDLGFLLIYAIGAGATFFWRVYGGTGSISRGMSDLLITGVSFGTFVVAKNVLRSDAEALRVLLALVAGTLTSAGLAFAIQEGLGYGRFRAFQENPNSEAVLLGIVFLAAFTPLADGRTDRRIHRLARASVPLVALGLVFTGSRGGLLAVLAASLALVITGFLGSTRSARRRRQVTNGGLVMVIALIIGLPALVEGVINNETQTGGEIVRLRSSAEQATASRLDLIQASWVVSTDHYLLGVGTAQYPYYHLDAIKRVSDVRDLRLLKLAGRGTHNEYMNVLVSSGLLGLVVFLCVLLGIGRRIRRSLAVSPRAPLAAALFVLLLVVMGAAIMTINPIFWLVMAVIVALVRNPPETLSSKR
jgi:O-antigen ligase